MTFQGAVHDVAGSAPDPLLTHPRGDGVGCSVKDVEQKRGDGLNVHGRERTCRNAGAEEPGEHRHGRAGFLGGPGLSGRPVKDRLVQAAEAQLEVEEPVDLLISRRPPVDRAGIRVAPGEILAVAIQNVIAYGNEEVVPGREVTVKVALRGAGLGRDVLDPATSRSANSQDSLGGL